MTWRGAALVTAGLLLAVGDGTGCRDGGGSSRSGGSRGESAAAADAGGAREPGGARQPEIAVLTGVRIRWTGAVHPQAVSDEDLSRRLGAALIASPAFLAEGEAVPAGRVAVPATVELTVHHDLVAPARGKAPRSGRVAVVGVEAEVDWKAGGERLRPRENVVVQRVIERREERRLDALIAALVDEAVGAAGRGLLVREMLRQGDDAAVLSALETGDADAVVWALDLAAVRRIAAAFDRAVALLDARDAGVRAAALRMLVALRDPRAVKPLARKADFADPETMRALVEAVTAIGGAEATEFLELVAGGHADPDMRQRAQEGLERLGRRQQRQGP